MSETWPDRKHPDLWVDPEDDPRATDEEWRGERAVVLGYLNHFRLTFAMKCEGLDAEQLATRSVSPSSMSLLGLLRHLGKVEHSWFRRVMEGNDIPRIYWSEDDRDLDFNGAVPDPAVVEDAWATWRAEVAHAEQYVEQAASLDVVGTHQSGPLELREVLVHLVEEYARHCGHADLLRECIDGRTGQ